MADKLTPQQQQAVDDRGGKLLVSAAAGSGKTKVLVDRLMKYLQDPVDPAHLDEFLIITYTKAAAAELRGKIAAKLSERIAQQPENRHLQRQLQRLYLTKISTVHAFCGDILREYAYRLDLPGDFRVADENECRELQVMAMDRVLEAAYDQLEDEPYIQAFLDTQGLGRDDRLIPEILLKVYNSARCHLDPEQWLTDCCKATDTQGMEDAAQSIWGAYLLEDLRGYLQLQISALEQCALYAAQADGMQKQSALLLDTVAQLKLLHKAQTWDEVCSFPKLEYGRLVFSKACTDEEGKQRIKAVREACKKGVEKKLRNFCADSATALAYMRWCAPAVEGMIALTRQFSQEYDRLKKNRRVLDFGDLEHKTLDLLLGKRRDVPTAAAREIGRRFREILVDEYQDSNQVQDAIFGALSEERQNCFMVGDVKQSIYQFRLADPGIFLDKYGRYVSAEQAMAGEGRKVNLSHNFRSGAGVIEAVNFIFHECMSPQVGGLAYTREEALQEGVPHVALEEPEVELLALDVQEQTYPEEAAMVAQRVKELLDGKHFVRNGEALRPIAPEDIVILLRSPGSVGKYYAQALEKQGVRCVSGGGEDLLQTKEIAALRSLLQVVSNPRQDIPLVAVLTSPLFCFSGDLLARMRGEDRKAAIYDVLCGSDDPKVREFLTFLQQLRKTARQQPLPQLLEEIFRVTRMDSIFATMPGGTVRRENLQTLYALAVELDANGGSDLEHFLDFLDSMEERGLIRTGAQTAAGAVTIMSIHKSKGLEFPVVFVCGLSREFNRESVRAQVLCHKDLGLGLTAVDERNRVRFPTIARQAIAAKTISESLSEEMRVLYVALTRARDRLIMTYAAKNLEKDLQEISARMYIGDPELMAQDVVCPGQWVLMAAMQRSEAGQLFSLGGKPMKTVVTERPWKIQVVSGAGEGTQTVCEETLHIPAHLQERIRQGLSFRYPHMAATAAPSKQTATQRKGRDKDAEAAEHAPASPEHGFRWRRPAFLEEKRDSAALGTAMHTCLQHIRYEACTNRKGVEAELRRMVLEGLLTQQQEEMINTGELAALFQSPMGRRLPACSQVLREFKFSILESGEAMDAALKEEQILLQGVVDCALIEEDGITVVDFKTDRVTEETVLSRAQDYAPQVEAYANALSRIFERPVKEKLLYFFKLGKTVSLD